MNGSTSFVTAGTSGAARDGLKLSRSYNCTMIDHVEELLSAGVWLGPAVLGSLSYRVLAGTLSSSGDDFPGALMLATAAVILTVAGTRFKKDHHAALAPVVFAAMFVASWSMR